MNIYENKRVFNTDLLKEGTYIGFRESWSVNDYKIGVIVKSSENQIDVAVYDEFSKNENRIDICHLELYDNYEIVIPEFTCY